MLLKFQKRAIRPGRFAALIAEPGRTGTLEPTGTVVLESATTRIAGGLMKGPRGALRGDERS